MRRAPIPGDCGPAPLVCENLAMASIMTVLGPVSPDALGPTYMHEHVLVDNSFSGNNPLKKLDEVDTLIDEMRDVRRAGGRTVVDCTCVGLAPDPAGLKRIAQDADVHLIACTGFYRACVWPTYVHTSSAEDLAERMIDDCANGLADTNVRPGMLAEFSAHEREGDGWVLPAAANKVFRAACIAQRETGLPITTHCGFQRADWQIAALRKGGVALDRVVLAHMVPGADAIDADRGHPVMEHLRRILDTGVNIGIDAIAYGERDGKPLAAADKARLVRTVAEWGHLEQVTVSLDMTRRYHLKKYGGHGFAFLMDAFAPMLREVGLSDRQVDHILVENPKRILTPG